MSDFTSNSLSELVSEVYNLTPPVHLEPMAKGTNNLSFLVTASGTDFVLKMHKNALNTVSLYFQNEMLSTLKVRTLPFAIPVPIPTKYGEIAHSTYHNGELVVLSLTHRIPGVHPGVGDQAMTFQCGTALGILNDAMAKIELLPGIPIPVAFPSLGLDHPAIPDPVTTIASLLSRTDVGELLEATEVLWRNQTDGWIPQLIHGDFFSPNVLVMNGAVSGVLDFEFSGEGHRAMDLAVGLRAFCLNNALSEDSWPLIFSFATGYMAHSPISPEERQAIPVLLLKRESSSFVHWLGRKLEGLPDHMDIEQRIDRLMKLDGWLNVNRQRLVEELDSISDT